MFALTRCGVIDAILSPSTLLKTMASSKIWVKPAINSGSKTMGEAAEAGTVVLDIPHFHRPRGD